MRGRRLVGSLLAAGLVALWSVFVSAQDDFDATACQQACEQRQATCVDACGTQDDAAECDAQCQHELEDCLRQCG